MCGRFSIAENYNTCPTEMVPVRTLNHTSSESTTSTTMKWGHVSRIGKLVINSRKESLHQFHRGLLICNGFYEWKDSKAYYINDREGHPLFLACVVFKDGFTIITQEASKPFCQIHHRMPVFIQKDQEHDWLNGKLSLLDCPTASDFLSWTRVSDHVNNTKNKDRKCIQPLAQFKGPMDSFLKPVVKNERKREASIEIIDDEPSPKKQSSIVGPLDRFFTKKLKKE